LFYYSDVAMIHPLELIDSPGTVASLDLDLFVKNWIKPLKHAAKNATRHTRPSTAADDVHTSNAASPRGRGSRSTGFTFGRFFEPRGLPLPLFTGGSSNCSISGAARSGGAASIVLLTLPATGFAEPP
jgi:hypothetical protein